MRLVILHVRTPTKSGYQHSKKLGLLFQNDCFDRISTLYTPMSLLPTVDSNLSKMPDLTQQLQLLTVENLTALLSTNDQETTFNSRSCVSLSIG